jgi:membrane associated rhomboid family serine protease
LAWYLLNLLTVKKLFSKINFPITALTVCVFSIFVSFQYISDSQTGTATGLHSWGVADPGDFWIKFIPWKAFTTAMVHITWGHLVWNIAWIGIWGFAIESELGSIFYIIFCFGACFASVCGGLALSGETGPGASGIFWAHFAFVWMLRNRIKIFQTVLPDFLSLFFLLLYIATWVDGMNHPGSTNAGVHMGGLVYGLLFGLGFMNRRSWIIYPVSIALVVISSVPLFWCPWSTTWVSCRSVTAFNAGKLDDAETLAMKALNMGQDPGWTWSLLANTYRFQGNQMKHRWSLMMLKQVNDSMQSTNKASINL